jgi:2-polyprenyl-6-methoxyphenol hydroxylase-like FAD-dependent oxidoreductase
MNTPISAINHTHALVIGGSMAGLLAARVLSDYFDSVTILERDAVNDAPESRKGQPHTRHLHGLLAKGLEVMAHYFPDLLEGLQEQGALVADMGQSIRWYTFGGYRLQAECGLRGALMSRPLLEWQIRQRVRSIANVRLVDQCDVQGPLFSADNRRITGVAVTLRAAGGEARTFAADLVVDASGRGAAAPKWLQANGYDCPEEAAVKVNMGYATRIYRRNPGDLEGAQLIMVTAEGPEDKRSGMVFPIEGDAEGDRWICTLGGINGDHPPLDERAFLAFARSLSAPDLYNLVAKLEPLSEIIAYKFPSSLRRHYERLERFPEGFLVMGDAICSFNPVYGQGMTVAAMEAQALDELLAGRLVRREAAQSDRQTLRTKGLDGLALEFFASAAKIVDIPWQMAVGADFRFQGTEGKKERSVDFVNAYVAKVHRATHRDPVVLEAFLKVMNLMQPPASLFHPKVLLRVLAGGWGAHPQAANAQRPAHGAEVAPVR